MKRGKLRLLAIGPKLNALNFKLVINIKKLQSLVLMQYPLDIVVKVCAYIDTPNLIKKMALLSRAMRHRLVD
jgi:hypothetical protein